jgi:hypothetical protein
MFLTQADDRAPSLGTMSLPPRRPTAGRELPFAPLGGADAQLESSYSFVATRLLELVEGGRT